MIENMKHLERLLQQHLSLIDNIIHRIEGFIQVNGRRPSILVAKLGYDGHNDEARVIASSFNDVGFDAGISPSFSTHFEVAKQAIDTDVYVIYVVILNDDAYKSLVGALIDCLREMNRKDIMITLGAVVRSEDHQALHDQEVQLIFGPGTRIAEAALKILDLIQKTFSSSSK